MSQPEPTSLVKGRRAMSPASPRSTTIDRKHREPSTPTTADSAPPRKHSTHRRRRSARRDAARLNSGGSRDTMQVSSLMIPRTLRPATTLISSPLLNAKNSAPPSFCTPESSKHFSRQSAAPTVDSSCKPKAPAVSPLAPKRRVLHDLSTRLPDPTPNRLVIPLRQTSVPPSPVRPFVEPKAVMRLLSAGQVPTTTSSHFTLTLSPICRPEAAPAEPQPLSRASIAMRHCHAPEIKPIQFSGDRPRFVQQMLQPMPSSPQSPVPSYPPTPVISSPPTPMPSNPPAAVISSPPTPMPSNPPAPVISGSPAPMPSNPQAPVLSAPPIFVNAAPTRVMEAAVVNLGRRWGLGSGANESQAKTSLEEVAALTTIAAPSIGGLVRQPLPAVARRPPPAVVKSVAPVADDEMSLRDVILKYMPRASGPPDQHSVPMVVGKGRLPMAIPESLEMDSMSGYLVPQGASHHQLTRHSKRRRPRNPFCLAC